MQESTIYDIIESACKHVVSYCDTYEMIYKKNAIPAQLCERFVVVLAELASSKLGLKWKDWLQIASSIIVSVNLTLTYQCYLAIGSRQ